MAYSQSFYLCSSKYCFINYSEELQLYRKRFCSWKTFRKLYYLTLSRSIKRNNFKLDQSKFQQKIQFCKKKIMSNDCVWSIYSQTRPGQTCLETIKLVLWLNLTFLFHLEKINWATLQNHSIDCIRIKLSRFDKKNVHIFKMI